MKSLVKKIVEFNSIILLTYNYLYTYIDDFEREILNRDRRTTSNVRNDEDEILNNDRSNNNQDNFNNMNEEEDYPVFPDEDEYLNAGQFSDGSMGSPERREKTKSPPPVISKKSTELPKKNLDPLDKYLDGVMDDLDKQTKFLKDEEMRRFRFMDSYLEEENSDMENSEYNSKFYIHYLYSLFTTTDNIIYFILDM